MKFHSKERNTWAYSILFKSSNIFLESSKIAECCQFLRIYVLNQLKSIQRPYKFYPDTSPDTKTEPGDGSQTARKKQVQLDGNTRIFHDFTCF